jgi:hypothetical protein
MKGDTHMSANMTKTINAQETGNRLFSGLTKKGAALAAATAFFLTGCSQATEATSNSSPSSEGPVATAPTTPGQLQPAIDIPEDTPSTPEQTSPASPEETTIPASGEWTNIPECNEYIEKTIIGLINRGNMLDTSDVIEVGIQADGQVFIKYHDVKTEKNSILRSGVTSC